jgi:hypothetical protein
VWSLASSLQGGFQICCHADEIMGMEEEEEEEEGVLMTDDLMIY